jgi:hypothetical protein
MINKILFGNPNGHKRLPKERIILKFNLNGFD